MNATIKNKSHLMFVFISLWCYSRSVICYHILWSIHRHVYIGCHIIIGHNVRYIGQIGMVLCF